MININDIPWESLTYSDIEKSLSSIDESFFFEFKEDKVQPSKIAEEVSAFSNTFGGYMFLGVDDDKKINGCEEWNEQRIYTVMHDSITPLPHFDVKRFENEMGIVVYVIRIDEGPETPYITNKGHIYERVSSSSCVVKDASKLTQLYIKRLDRLKDIERKITIHPIETGKSDNIIGYIDIGFDVV